MKKQILFLIILLSVFILFSSYALAEDNIKTILSDYPYISEIERSIISKEIKEAIDLGVDTYDIESLISLAKKRKISPLALKDIVSLINQAAKLHLYPDLLLNKAKEGLLKRVREDLIVEVLKKRLDYLRTSKLIIDSLNGKISPNDKEELTFIIVQNLENGLSEDVVTKLINYSFKKSVSFDAVGKILDDISVLPAVGIDDDAILKLGEFFFKRNVSESGVKEVTDVILLAIKLGISPDKLSDFLKGAYRYRDYISLRNAILRIIREGAKKNKIKKHTPSQALPPPPK